MTIRPGAVLLLPPNLFLSIYPNPTMDFDETRLYYSHQQLQTVAEDENADQANAVSQEQEEEDINLEACRRHFREFLRTSWPASDEQLIHAF